MCEYGQVCNTSSTNIPPKNEEKKSTEESNSDKKDDKEKESKKENHVDDNINYHTCDDKEVNKSEYENVLRDHYREKGFENYDDETYSERLRTVGMSYDRTIFSEAFLNNGKIKEDFIKERFERTDRKSVV